jgi:Zn-dependent peptidase ImmA (M78 family)
MTNEALVTPSVMKWAREHARLDISTAADKLQRPENDIAMWESGEKRPTLAQAKKASEVYKRSLAVFYLPEPPKDFDTIKDFRLLPDKNLGEWSPELALLIRQIMVKQQWLSEYFQEIEMEKIPFIGSAATNISPDKLANEIRKYLNFDISEQIKCKEPREAFNLWIEYAETAGVNICRQGGIESEEARGFALTDEYAPFIYINSNDSYAGRLFTLVHELAHLWINQSGISNLLGNYERARRPEDKIEYFCNQVAGKTLVDDQILLSQWKVRNAEDSLIEQVQRLAHHFSVSGEVIARRLLEQNSISQIDYRELRNHYLKEWEKHKTKKASGFLVYGHRRVLENGNYFSQNVLGAYQQGRLLARDASVLLNVKVNHFDQLKPYLHNVKRGGMV